MITLPVVNGIVQGTPPRNAILAVQSATQCVYYQPGDTLPVVAGPTPQETADEIAAQGKLRTDAEAARQYPKLQVLLQQSPAEARAWVQANVTNLAEAKDAIATLFALCSVLGRPLAGGAVPRSGPPELAATKAAPPTMWQRTVKGTKSLLRMK